MRVYDDPIHDRLDGRAPAVGIPVLPRVPDHVGRGYVTEHGSRPVDLILGQGKLKAGCPPPKLNAPGKFLISAPGHDTPRRARAYLVTDHDVTDTVARYAATRPPRSTPSHDLPSLTARLRQRRNLPVTRTPTAAPDP